MRNLLRPAALQNLTLVGPDKSKLYSLALRPLLPDETK